MPKKKNGRCSVRRHVLWLAVLALLSGCAASCLSPDSPEALIPDRSAQVAGSRLDRQSVQRILGTPQLSSVYWGFDLFRAGTEQNELVFAITPWPVPLLRVKDQLKRYTLVTYDAGGITDAVATGIFRRPSSWRSGSPIKHDYPGSTPGRPA